MTPWRIDGTLAIRRREDDPLCGVVLHDGQAWIAEAKWLQPSVARQAFAAPEAAAAWFLDQDPRPAPKAPAPTLRILPGGAIVQTVTEGPAWYVEAVLRERPDDLPLKAALPGDREDRALEVLIHAISDLRLPRPTTA